MSESFVDLTYRGLTLGRKVKLTQVRPSSGYLEHVAPMPVGTSIGIAGEDGTLFDALVTDVREQTGDVPPGMTVRPRLEVDAAKAWWKEKVELPDVVKVEAAPPVGIVRSKRGSNAGAVPELMDDGRNTAVQAAIDPDKLEKGDKGDKDTQVIPVMDSNPTLPAIQDDGKRTIAMDAVDLAALGLDPATSSGSIPTIKDEDEGDGDDDKPEASKSGPAGKKKRRRR